MGTSLKGRTAIVTGSTSGIGLGIAQAFAAEGANVVINGLGSDAEIKAATDMCTGKGGVGKIVYDPANMMKPTEIAAMVAKAEKDFGSVDILVNNAGIQHVAPIEEFPIDKWDAIIAINLSSAFHGIRAAIPGMKARKYGRIVSIASAHSLVASPFKSAYVAAKHGIAGLTKCVALETAMNGITVNAISPGYVWTPLVEKQLPDIAKTQKLSMEDAKSFLLAKQPSKQFVTIEQVADLTMFLASEGAGSITGSNYSIDGGWVAE